jgi:hypothetical protein
VFRFESHESSHIRTRIISYFICNSHVIRYTFLANEMFIHSSIAVEPFVEPWPLLYFRTHFYTPGRTPWTSDQSVARPLPICRKTQSKCTGISALSGIRTHDPSVRASEDSSYLTPRRHCDRLIPSLVCFSSSVS